MSRQSLLALDFASQRSNLRSPRKTAEANRRHRLWIILGVAGVWMSIVIARLVSLQITSVERWQEWALKQHFSEITIASERGTIVDRKDRLLAVSVPAGSVYVRPRQVKDKPAAAREIAKMLSLPEKDVLKKLNGAAPFVWIQRQLPRVRAEQVSALDIPGVGHIVEARRFYPYNEAASTLIGRVGVDGVGLSGVESLFEKRLHGAHVKTRVTRDALGNQIEMISAAGGEEFDLPTGESLRLTLDSDIQVIMDDELEAGRRFAKSKAAMAVMVDADTGDVLGMSQVPSVNFNSDKVHSTRGMKNLIVESVFEPGSIMKPLVAASVLDAGVASARDILNCEAGRFRVGKHTIKDVHPSSSISFFDVVVRSSNIGMTKVGMRLGADRLYASLRSFGFGESTKLGLPGETRGILRPVESWAQVDVATHSFGQGVAVTPLQVVRAVSAIANGGMLPKLSVIDDGTDPKLRQGDRILSERAATIAREMMYGVVEDEHGTGGNAAIEGVRIGGKTGTAQKARTDGRGYAAGLYVASFVGFAEADSLGVKRRLSLLVMIDEPHTNSIYGGTLAAPVFKRIMQRTLHYLSTSDGLHVPDTRFERRKLPDGKELTQVNYIP